MAARIDLRALRVRFMLLFASILTAALLAFAGAAYLAAVAAEAAEEEPEADKQRELAAARKRITAALLAALPLALATAIGGAHLLGRRVFSTLGAIVRTASALSLERLDLRIPDVPGAGREIEELVHALNGMLARIEHAATGLRRFTADAAHELRTPLAGLASEIEICLRRPRDEAQLREVLETTLEGLGRLGLLVDTLLTLARSDAGTLVAAPRACDLCALVEQIAEPYAAVAAERELSLILDTGSAPGTAPARGSVFSTDPVLLGRALANLLDNACKFCAPGGTVWVRLREGRDEDAQAGGITITVTDTGPTPSSADLARAGERFYRGPAHRGSTPGFGLGLSICREFITALDGSLRLQPTEDGCTEARIWLPDHLCPVP